MSTDICDPDLKALRNNRWDKAFKKGDMANHVDSDPRDEVNRKATIVIEHSKLLSAQLSVAAAASRLSNTHYSCLWLP